MHVHAQTHIHTLFNPGALAALIEREIKKAFLCSVLNVLIACSESTCPAKLNKHPTTEAQQVDF